jgi:UDPglucose--hexose-1-phosphate uridylyltransferase
MSRTLPPPALPNAPGELRQDPLGGGWVAITAGRAARPEAFLGDIGPSRGPLGCPFCPGNEHMTPPEVWADRDPGTEPDHPGWHVRVVPNKFPAFAGPLNASAAKRNGSPLYRSAPTAGVHEVVIHNPDHQATLADLEVPEVARAVAAWRARMAAYRDQALGAVLVIVNQGRTAGASLEHPHSQVFATAGRPDRVRAELERLAGDACAACATVAAERRPAPALPWGRGRPCPLQPGPALGPARHRRLPLASAPAPPPDHLRRVRAGHRGDHQRGRPRPGRRGAAG